MPSALIDALGAVAVAAGTLGLRELAAWLQRNRTQQTARPPMESVGNLHHPLVLLVDDDEGTRKIWVRLLGHAGIDVHAVETAEEGLALARRHSYDARFIDRTLHSSTLDGKPTNGEEVLRRMRRRPVDVLVTGGTIDMLGHVVSDGIADAVMEKPMEDLVGIVEHLLAGVRHA